MDQEEIMTKASLKWEKIISKFNSLMFMSCSDADFNREVLLDALQDLFSEDLNISSKIKILVFLQQEVDVLLDSIDSAEQVFGSLWNVFNSVGAHYVVMKSQILVTLTSILCLFERKTLSLEKEYINLLFDTISKVNIHHPVLLQTCSECLRIIEETHPNILESHLRTVLATITEERSFSTYSYQLLLASIVRNMLQNHSIHEGHQHEQDVTKCLSLLIKQFNVVSPTIILQQMNKILPCLSSGKIPKLVITSIVDYCSQSWNLLLLFVALLMQKELSFLRSDENLVKDIIMKLLHLNNSPQLNKHQQSIINVWLLNFIKQISLTELRDEVCFLAAESIKPNPHEPLARCVEKLQALAEISNSRSIELYLNEQSYMLKLLLMKYEYNKSVTDVSFFFRGLFSMYRYYDETHKKEILHYTEEMTINSLQLASHTIDFIDAIDQLNQSNNSSDLWQSLIMQLFRLSLHESSEDLTMYLLLLEKVAAVKTICPLSLINKLDLLCHSSILQTCNWKVGNILLSICRNILLNAATEQIRYDVSGLLWSISQSFQNKNICDKALFYYSIAGNISMKYYGELFMSTDNKQTKNKNNVSDINDVAARTTSRVVLIETPFLILEKHDSRESICHNENVVHFTSHENLHREYMEMLASPKCKKDVKHRFSLSFDEQVHSSYLAIYAIKLDLISTGSFEEVSSVCFPHLVKKTTQDKQSEGEQFVVSFTPLSPKPTEFLASVSFMSEDDKDYVLHLPTFKLEFQDLFLPLSKLENQDTKILFDALWAHIEENQKTIATPDYKCALSIKYLRNVVVDNIMERFQKFQVTGNCIGIFLPPISHVLLKVVPYDESSTIMKIAVDDYNLLKNIHIYIETLS